jgi:archaellum biogenesis ATPase FlaH
MGITMVKMEKKESTRYLRDNLYTTGSLNLMTGKGGEGKSVIAMAIAKELKAQNMVEQVVYLDSDSKGNGALELNNYCYENNLSYVDTTTMLDHTLTTHLKVMQKLLTEDIDPNSVVIIDALSNLASDISSNKEMVPIMEFFVKITKQKNLTLIVVHHTRKEDDSAIGATAINTRAEAIHLVKDIGTKFKPNKKLSILKDNSGKLGLGFDVKFTANAKDSCTFSIEVEFKQVKIDPYEGMSKVERRKAIKENYLLMYLIAYTTSKEYSPMPTNKLKLDITKHINKDTAKTIRNPTDEFYIGSTFISKNMSDLIDTYFEVVLEKQEVGRSLKIIHPILKENLKKLNIGTLPKLYK